jgi:hypothetical protein
VSTEEIVRNYPDLEPGDVREALSYASALASEEVHPFRSPHESRCRPTPRSVITPAHRRSDWGRLLSGNFLRQSGEPFSVYTGRGTFNRQSNLQTNQGNTTNTNLTMDELRGVFTYRMTGNGPFMVSASAVGNDGRAVAPDGSAAFAGQVFFMPAAGTIGSLGRRVFDGPWDTTFDFGVGKIISLTERQYIVLRMDSTNFLNHPAFVIGDQTATSTTFGKITSTYAGSRVIQFVLAYRF